jgi:serine O-acetyltransferase
MKPIKLYYAAHWCYKRHIPILPKALQLILFMVFEAVIPYKVRIGENCTLAHGGNGIVIHPDVQIGNNVIICHQVTIGGRGRWSNVPKIGNDVYIAPGAKILGPIRIGNNCIIGANAVVCTSFPAKCVVAGIPARILRRNVDSHDVEVW